MFVVYDNVNNYFNEILSDISCQQDTKAYIVSIYDKYKSNAPDFSKKSITVLFAEAKYTHDFVTYQNIGDWIFFANTLTPGHLKYASKDYYDTIAQLSYYSCYRLINKQWKLFEELADNFQYIEVEVKDRLQKFNK
jgi:hypothetical protein